MPVLAQILANAFSGVLSWLTVLLGRKLAVGSALAAFLVAGWVALQLALKAAADTLTLVIPTELSGPLGLLAYMLPENFGTCVSCIVTAKIGRWLWDRQREWSLAMAAS